MKKILFSILAINLMLLFSCQKNKSYKIEVINGVKTIINERGGVNPDFNIELTKLYEINSEKLDSVGFFSQVVNWDIDSKNNLFICDMKTSTVKKFSPDGKFAKSFSHKGQGPGEIDFAQGMMMIQDSIMVLSVPNNKMVLFDNKGNFIRDFNNKPSTFPVYLSGFNDGAVCYMCIHEKTKKEYRIYYNLNISNKNFSKNIELTKNYGIRESDGTFSGTKLYPYSCNSNYLYYSKGEKDKYQIEAYNQKGEHKFSIKRNFIPLQNTKNEYLFYSKDNTYKYYEDQKNSIEELLVDENNYLWVKSVLKRNKNNMEEFYVEIYKDGILLKQVKLNLGFSSEKPAIQFKLKNNRLYVFDYSTNIFTVYKYKYINE